MVVRIRPPTCGLPVAILEFVVYRDPTGCLTAFYFSPFEVRKDSNPSGDGLSHLSRAKLGGAATPLLALYTRGAGLHDGVLVGYNYTSSVVRKVRFYPYSGRSFMISCAASSPCVSRLEWLYWATVWIPRVTSSTVAPEHLQLSCSISC